PAGDRRAPLRRRADREGHPAGDRREERAEARRPGVDRARRHRQGRGPAGDDDRRLPGEEEHPRAQRSHRPADRREAERRAFLPGDLGEVAAPGLRRPRLEGRPPEEEPRGDRGGDRDRARLHRRRRHPVRRLVQEVRMTARPLVLAGAGALATAVLAAAALAATPPPAKKPNPCKGIKNCITVNGPWVAVPANGPATFLLECPKRNGYVGGIDALASSDDVRMSWDARLPSPINTPLTKTTNSITGPYAFFSGYSAAGKQGLMQPWIGCVPTP